MKNELKLNSDTMQLIEELEDKLFDVIVVPENREMKNYFEIREAWHALNNLLMVD